MLLLLQIGFPSPSEQFFCLGLPVFVGTTTQTLMQHAVDESVRGRVLSLYGMIHRGAPALGAIIMGGLAELVGIRVAVATGIIVRCRMALDGAERHRCSPMLLRKK